MAGSGLADGNRPHFTGRAPDLTQAQPGAGFHTDHESAHVVRSLTGRSRAGLGLSYAAGCARRLYRGAWPGAFDPALDHDRGAARRPAFSDATCARSGRRYHALPQGTTTASPDLAASDGQAHALPSGPDDRPGRL